MADITASVLEDYDIVLLATSVGDKTMTDDV
jgi:hypothetical protein